MLIKTNRCRCTKSINVVANKDVFIGEYCSTCFEVTSYERGVSDNEQKKQPTHEDFTNVLDMFKQ